MAGLSHKYYLAVDGVPIDFSRAPKFEGMEDFLKLCVFTGIFNNEKELLDALVKMRFIPEEKKCGVLSIVKRSGKSQDEVAHVSHDIVYKDTFTIMSKGWLKRFLSKNRYHSDAILELLEDYHNTHARLLSIFEARLEKLDRELSECSVAAAKFVIDDMSKLKRSMSKFQFQLSNIEAIEVILQRNKGIEGSPYDRDDDLEYIDRLDLFVDQELNYIRKTKRTPNKRGLVRLAIAVTKMIDKYPDLEIPRRQGIASQQHLELLIAIKNTLLNPVNYPADLAAPVVGRPHKVLFDDDEVDPDSFMFLEEEDYEKLYPKEGMTKGERESLELAIENLNEKKGRFRP